MTDRFAEYLKQFDGELERLGSLMPAELGSQVPVIKEMQQKKYFSGGKRLRALVAVLAARLCGVSETIGSQVAISIEFIHTATLLHDDVVDDAPIRRHLPAAAKLYGSAVAVLAGDFLYSRASQMLARLQNLTLQQRVADITNQLAEGELLQLVNRGKPDLDEHTYYTIIQYKTANLFAVAAQAAAILQGADDKMLHQYGMQLGMAFQLVDDCLDYEGEGSELGKKIGADLKEGKMTLPVIVMLARTDDKNRRAFMQQWQAGADVFDQTVELLHSTDALAAVRQLASERTAQAVAALAPYPDSEEKAMLTQLAQLSAQRTK